MQEHQLSSSAALHPRLAADCHVLGDLPSSTLLLHRNAALHWFILVPPAGGPDVLDLERGVREALFDDAARVAAYLKHSLAYPRVNVGALGLVVPQLHLHVVGRRPDDPCWPAPVWGNLGDGTAVNPTYTDASLAGLRSALVGQ